MVDVEETDSAGLKDDIYAGRSADRRMKEREEEEGRKLFPNFVVVGFGNYVNPSMPKMNNYE